MSKFANGGLPVSLSMIGGFCFSVPSIFMYFWICFLDCGRKEHRQRTATLRCSPSRAFSPVPFFMVRALRGLGISVSVRLDDFTEATSDSFLAWLPVTLPKRVLDGVEGFSFAASSDFASPS